MRTPLALTLACFTAGCVAQELALPTTMIAPADVDQSSIRIHCFSTNVCAVRFKYSEKGAQKMLAFRKEHVGQKVLLQVGRFEAELQLASAETGTGGGPDNSWLQHRTDKIFCANEDEAKLIAEGMRQ